jgi:opacity protein-like surface antigen
MKKLLLAFLALAAFAPPALATGFADGTVGSKYVVLDLGFITYSQGSAAALSIGGGYQVHPAVAVEVDYLMANSASYGPFNLGSHKLSALEVMAVGHYTFNSQFSAYAKAGLALNNQTLTNPVNGIQDTPSSNDIAVGIGAKYNVSPDFALRLQYLDTGVSSSIISVGAMVNF